MKERLIMTNPLFVSRQAELIFCLTKVGSVERDQLLGIEWKHYEDAAKADELLASIRIELIDGPLDTSEALKQLQRIHSHITKDWKHHEHSTNSN